MPPKSAFKWAKEKSIQQEVRPVFATACHQRRRKVVPAVNVWGGRQGIAV